MSRQVALGLVFWVVVIILGLMVLWTAGGGR